MEFVAVLFVMVLLVAGLAQVGAQEDPIEDPLGYSGAYDEVVSVFGGAAPGHCRTLVTAVGDAALKGEIWHGGLNAEVILDNGFNVGSMGESLGWGEGGHFTFAEKISGDHAISTAHFSFAVLALNDLGDYYAFGCDAQGSYWLALRSDTYVLSGVRMGYMVYEDAPDGPKSYLTTQNTMFATASLQQMQVMLSINDPNWAQVMNSDIPRDGWQVAAFQFRENGYHFRQENGVIMNMLICYLIQVTE